MWFTFQSENIGLRAKVLSCTSFCSVKTQKAMGHVQIQLWYLIKVARKVQHADIYIVLQFDVLKLYICLHVTVSSFTKNTFKLQHIYLVIICTMADNGKKRKIKLAWPFHSRHPRLFYYACEPLQKEQLVMEMNGTFF